ncbi:MAG: phosphoribosylglycinamide formyltransferase [Nitriliruptorales bacterium]|nr:phosphoribosylglycinamide formyltransferase [Nitriliruptorales bacterium]
MTRDDGVRRLAVLVSGSGTNLQALLDAAAAGDLGADIVVVGSDRRDAYGLERAEQAGVATVCQELGDHPDRSSWEQALIADLQQHEPEAVVLAGFMKLVSPAFLTTWAGRVLNTHPSLLPAFKGAHAVRDALEYGVKVTGSTVHFVDEKMDHGPIIAQRPVEIHPDDDEDSLHERIKQVEHELLPHCVSLLCAGRLEIDGRHVRIHPASG